MVDNINQGQKSSSDVCTTLLRGYSKLKPAFLLYQLKDLQLK